MPRIKNDSGKSTVLKMRDGSDWGRILYDACHVFNQGFANYLQEYVERYDNGEIVVKDADGERSELVKRRDQIINERNALHNLVRNASADKVNAFRKYAKALPIGSIVSKWRRGTLNGECDASDMQKYRELINDRNELNNAYHACLMREKVAIENERKHIDSNLFMTRTLNRQIKNVMKMAEKHGVSLGHKMHDDVQPLVDLILSEGQTERLMAVCINILNTYSEKEFSTIMVPLERERIAEKIFGFFSKFEHNYDFIAGCYDVDEETGMLKLKPLDVLAGKIYNGYYFTIRGYVQRSYASVRFEKFNVESADANWEHEDDTGNHGIDRLHVNEYDICGGALAPREPQPLDEGLLDIWKECNEYLMASIPSMSLEISSELSQKFPRNPYYHDSHFFDRVMSMMQSVVGDIDGVLESGNVVGNKLKHIVLDSMGGAETGEEWRQNVIVITNTMMKYMRKFFVEEKLCHYDENGEYVWSFEND